MVEAMDFEADPDYAFELVLHTLPPESSKSPNDDLRLQWVLHIQDRRFAAWHPHT